jgi:hypothetical protein
MKLAEGGDRKSEEYQGLVNLPTIDLQPIEGKPTHTQITPKVINPINTRKEAATLAKVSEKTYAKGNFSLLTYIHKTINIITKKSSVWA